VSCRVLIADADVGWLDRCELGLGENGFIVDTVQDALACLGRLLSGPFPDVLVLDLDLPWGGGDGVLDWLREEQRSVLSRCVIIATGKASPAALSQRMKLPMAHCLQKPVSLARLRNAVGWQSRWHPLAASQGSRFVTPTRTPWETRMHPLRWRTSRR
jgi:CheY-like chemotaxis protein